MLASATAGFNASYKSLSDTPSHSCRKEPRYEYSSLRRQRETLIPASVDLTASARAALLSALRSLKMLPVIWAENTSTKSLTCSRGCHVVSAKCNLLSRPVIYRAGGVGEEA